MKNIIILFILLFNLSSFAQRIDFDIATTLDEVIEQLRTRSPTLVTILDASMLAQNLGRNDIVDLLRPYVRGEEALPGLADEYTDTQIAALVFRAVMQGDLTEHESEIMNLVYSFPVMKNDVDTQLEAFLEGASRYHRGLFREGLAALGSH